MSQDSRQVLALWITHVIIIKSSSSYSLIKEGLVMLSLLLPLLLKILIEAHLQSSLNLSFTVCMAIVLSSISCHGAVYMLCQTMWKTTSAMLLVVKYIWLCMLPGYQASPLLAAGTVPSWQRGLVSVSIRLTSVQLVEVSL